MQLQTLKLQDFVEKFFISNILLNLVRIRIRIWIQSLTHNFSDVQDPQHC
jgi:hypothetical protein